MSRLATLSQGGKTLTYSRLTNSDRLDKAEFSPASAAPAVEYSYDTKLRLISKGCGTRYFTDKDEVWYFDCPAGTPGNWGTSRYYSYDSMGQLTLAGEGALGPDGQVDNPQNFSYDSIGNHLTNNETYSILNQGSGKTYDANGNMTRNGDDWVALYDGENRLRTVSHPYDGVELLYDYAGRIYQVNSFYADEDVQETPTLNYRRIYDGTKLIATVRNGAIEDTFVWQPETSGDADVILWDKNYVYATDPNKNVRVKRFPNDWIPGTWVEEFIDYKPFGELKNYVADPPRFMFSSEEYMPETGMYHYLYRAYSPSLARFITRDPIEEAGGVNLYCFVNNNPVSYWDVLGLSETTDDTNIFELFCEAIDRIKRFKWYKNWGGPGWAAGQWVEDFWSIQHPEYLLVPALDELDQCYKDHDICYENCRKDCNILTDLCFSKCDYIAVVCQAEVMLDQFSSKALFGAIALGLQGNFRLFPPIALNNIAVNVLNMFW